MKSFSTSAPNFLCRPDRVKGIPILREIRALAAEIPTSLLHEKPPLFISFLPVFNFFGMLQIQDIYLNQTDLVKV